MAKTQNVFRSAVARICKPHGLKPHRITTLKFFQRASIETSLETKKATSLSMQPVEIMVLGARVELAHP